MTNTYIIPIPSGTPRRLATTWLLLAIASLIIAGLYSVLLVICRTPFLQDIFPLIDFFHIALIVHVDLSVLIWFLAFSGLFWSLNSTSRMAGPGWFAVVLSIIGSLIIALSPFLGAENPLMNNYIPILNDSIFFIGLVMFGLGFLMMHVRSLLTTAPFGKITQELGTLRFGMYTAAIISLVSMAAFAWSFFIIPHSVDDTQYYELLFWGGGHLLQFTHTILLLVSWLWLCGLIKLRVPVPPVVNSVLFGYFFIVALITPVIFLSYNIESYDFREAFTSLMKYGPIIPVTLIGLFVFLALFTNRGKMERTALPFRAALISSLLLFGAGGVIGFLIEGTNVTIPSHYHGSIVGVTLAFMGLTYHLLPQLGFKAPMPKLSHFQPYIYGLGNLLFILGLAWAGGYGIQRKTAGGAQGLVSVKEIASMILMGVGGFVAVAGGVLFLVICIVSVFRRNDSL